MMPQRSYAEGTVDRAVLETASDRYVIVEYLAEGGMGAIYLGKKLGVDGFEKEVVLKQLLPEFTREPKFIDLFLREARLSASLDHANIVRTVDLVNAGDDYFMVMEYVRGGDLRTLLRRARRQHQRFFPQAAVFIGHEILEALAYAHAKTGTDGRPLNLIHRDISPSNILLSGAGEVKLTDFGIAKASTHASVFYKVKGKVGYMSPEQARGEPVDKRADLFSLGVVLYEVLVGERLFVGDLMSTASMVYSQKITPPSRKRPDIPPELDEVILRALSLEARGRYQSAEEFQEALNRAATRTRLHVGASEMASHLKQVCGDDPSTWLKLETLPHGADESQVMSTHGHGTAVLPDSGADDDDDGFEDSPHPARKEPMAALAKKELTSVVALKREDIEILDEEPTSRPLRLQRGSGGASQPTPTPTPTSRFQPIKSPAREPAPTFDSDESLASHPTTVRTHDNRPRRSPTGENTLVRQSSAPASSFVPTEQLRTPPPREVDRDLGRDEHRPIVGATGPSQTLAPPSEPFEHTDSLRRAQRRRRVLPIVILLLVIGIGVAVGVAFSGPELDVTDPEAPPAPSRTTPAPLH